jgi:hypothetical protein
MNRKQTFLICLSIIAIIGGIILNIRQFVHDYCQVTNKNAIVTFVYISIWLLILIIAIKNKYMGIIKYSMTYWMVSLILAVLAIYSIVTGANSGWLILPALLFLSQWSGIKFYIESYIHIYIIIIFISLSILTTSIIAIHHYKSNHI